MKHEIEDITDGSLNGKYAWICDFRYDDYSNKPIRHIKPQYVLVRSNSETTKYIYYSDSHFVGLNKKGVPLKSKVIPLFDNTGFRSRTGTPLNCFDNESECREYYKGQLAEAIEGLKVYRDSLTASVDNKINELNELSNNN